MGLAAVPGRRRLMMCTRKALPVWGTEGPEGPAGFRDDDSEPQVHCMEGNRARPAWLREPPRCQQAAGLPGRDRRPTEGRKISRAGLPPTGTQRSSP